MSSTSQSRDRRSALLWKDGRWHCASVGIHAGAGMELRGDNGQWFRVRVESADGGRRLIAYLRVHGLDFTYRINPEYDHLRWPS